MIAKTLRHREGGQRRNNRFNGFLVLWQCAAENVIQQQGREATPFKESVARKRRGRLPRCASRVCEIATSYVSKWIGKEREASSFLPLTIFEAWLFSASVFSAHGSLLCQCFSIMFISPSERGRGVDRGVTGDNEEGAERGREGGRV